jgi:hypothetical protein
MFTKNEVVAILICALIIGFAMTLENNLQDIGIVSLLGLITLMINIIPKKFLASYHDLRIEHKMWEFKKYGFAPHERFKNFFPWGLLLCVVTPVVTAGYLVWMALLEFTTTSEVHRVARKREYRMQFPEPSEFHIGLIAGIGILFNIIFAIIFILLNYPILAKMNIFYAFFNVLPVGRIDGNKMVFAGIGLWKFFVVITIVLMGFLLVYL